MAEACPGNRPSLRSPGIDSPPAEASPQETPNVCSSHFFTTRGRAAPASGLVLWRANWPPPNPTAQALVA